MIDRRLVLPVVVASAILAGGLRTAGQQPQSVELDAATIAVRTEAARNLVPLLQDVKQRATSTVTVKPGGAPNSPFAGTQTTLLSFTIGKRNTPVDPQVVQALDRMLKWEPGDRSNEEQARLFDEWLNQLSRRATGLKLQTTTGACDTNCVVQTMTRLDDTWGEQMRDRAETRDGVLLDAFVDALKAAK